ncbi:MAG: hypothetical protein V4674_03950 [Patescibacteria group bacterium]
MKKLFFIVSLVFSLLAPTAIAMPVYAAPGDEFQNDLFTSQNSQGTYYKEFTLGLQQGGGGSGARGTCASSGARIRDLKGLLCYAQDIINYNIIPLIFAYALLMFLWGVVSYIQKPDLAEQAKQKILYGVFGLAAMVSVWGLVNLVVRTFNLDNTPIRVQDIQVR